jgi:hypothetical protein
MTAPDLRDQMAMAALPGAMADDYGLDWRKHNRSWPAKVAERAYQIADAMLAERNRTTKGEDHV